MLETAIVSFTTFFATIGPIDVIALFAALTSGSKYHSHQLHAVARMIT